MTDRITEDRLLPLHIVAKRLRREVGTVQKYCRERRIECVRDTLSGRYFVKESVLASIFVDVPKDTYASMDDDA